jgi:hypothetical protein
MSFAVLDEDVFASVAADASRLDTSALSRALEPIMQVAPSMATATLAGGRQLMEVVVNGNLAAAADGNGLRAFVMGADGIKEHARLFEPTTLQNVANAAAIWQLASVVVAQKHLADISATLKRVESKVEGIQSFMEEQRLAVVRSVMTYLATAKRAMASGEFLERTRDKLEDFEVELQRVAMSLSDQMRRESRTALEEDTLGCEGEYRSALAKHQRLARLGEELVLCNEVRLANWYLCSLYHDRSKMLEPRLEQIHAVIEHTEELNATLGKAAHNDIFKIKSWMTSDETISSRRREVRAASVNAASALLESKTRCETMLAQLGALQLDRLATNRLIIEAHDGVPSAVYLCHEQPVGERLRSGSAEPVVA